MSEKALAFLRELERADEAVSAFLAELDELAGEADALGARALDLETFLVRLPAERERLAAGRGEAEREARAAGEELALARRELAAAGEAEDRERLAAARRREVRARDTLRMAERRARDVREREERLEEEAARAERETSVLEERALELARSLRGRPRLAEQAGANPDPGLAGVSEWASRARAALFVARGGVAAEREAVIRQANELGALVLGEPLTAMSASVVARRVEQALGD